MKNPYLKTGFYAVLAAALSAPLSQAANRVWNGTGDWTEAARWGGTVPASGDTAIMNSGVSTVSSGNFTVVNMYLARVAGLPFELSVQGGTVNVNWGLHVGYEANTSATVTINGSNSKFYVNGDNATYMSLGHGAGSEGYLRLTNGGYLNVNSSVAMVGQGNNAYGYALVDSGSTWINAGGLFIADSAGARGEMVITGGGYVRTLITSIGASNQTASGSLIVSGAGTKMEHTGTSGMLIGNTGTGTLLIEDGALVESTRSVIGVNNANSNGHALVRGDDTQWINSRYLTIGSYGTGVLDFEGGLIEATNVTIGEKASGNGLLNIAGEGNGRLVDASGNPVDITGGSGSAVVRFSYSNPGGGIDFDNKMSGTLSVEHVTSDTTVLGAANDYTGNTTIYAGTIKAGIADTIAHSNMVFVHPDAAFDMGGFDQRLQNLDNNGTVYFNSNSAFNTLHVEGDLTGSGEFHMNTDIGSNTLEGNNGNADLLVVDGTASGDHRLIIRNAATAVSGKEPALLLVTTGTSDGTFRGSADVGMYTYSVQSGAEAHAEGKTTDDSPDNWYLVRGGSDSLNPEEPGPIDPDPDPVGNTGNSVLAISTAPYAMWFNDTLLKRMGDLRLGASNMFGTMTDRCQKGRWESWIRTHGSGHIVDRSVTGNSFRQNYYGVDLGVDQICLKDNRNILITGFFAGYGRLDQDYRTYRGRGNSDSFHLGGYATWLHENGWYADLVGKVQRFDNSFSAYDESGNNTRGDYLNLGLGASLEVGRRFKNEKGWFIEPQLQASYVHFTDANYTTIGDNVFNVSLSDADVAQFRGGVVAGRTIPDGRHTWQPYLKAGVIEQVSSGGHVRADGGEWRPNLDGTRAVVGAGVIWQIGNKHQLHLDYEASFASKYTMPWNVNLGYRFIF